jgi:hypothetical protein
MVGIGGQWYAGEGPPFSVPMTEWIPNAVIRSPKSGDQYLDVVTGMFYECAIAGEGQPELISNPDEFTDESLWKWMGEKEKDEQ